RPLSPASGAAAGGGARRLLVLEVPTQGGVAQLGGDGGGVVGVQHLGQQLRSQRRADQGPEVVVQPGVVPEVADVRSGTELLGAGTARQVGVLQPALLPPPVVGHPVVVGAGAQVGGGLVAASRVDHLALEL